MKRRHDIRHIGLCNVIGYSCFALLYLPIIILIVYSFNDNNSLSIWTEFSFRWYRVVFEDRELIASAIRSIQIAVASGLISTSIAICAAVATTNFTRSRRDSIAYAILSAPLMIPEVVIAVGLLITFAEVRSMIAYRGLGYLIVAHVGFCIPFAYIPIRSRMRNLDQSLFLAAGDLYASKWQIFRKITLPLLMPAVFAALSLTLIVSLDDAVISEFVKTAGQDTLPTYILGQLHRAITPKMNAISTLMLLVSTLIICAFYFVFRGKGRLV